MARRKKQGGRPGKGRGDAKRGRPGRGRGASRKGAPTPDRVFRLLEGRAPALLSPAAIAAALSLGKGASKEIRSVLRALEKESKVERVRGRYRALRAGARLEGWFAREDRRSIVTDDGGGVWRVGRTDGVRSGDRVAIEPYGDPSERRADVLHVVGGDRDDWVGILQIRGKLAYVTPYRDDASWVVRVARNDRGDALDGEVVRLEPTHAKGRASRSKDPEPWARVVERLGRPGDPKADVAAVMWRHRLPAAFSKSIEAEAREQAADPGDVDTGRRDLREVEFYTIDPASARDHDDAVCAQRREDGGYRLFVAIADVAAYVGPGSLIDREAFERGSSVYFPTQVVPMLPHALSSGACSLRPDEDRRVLVAEMEFDAAGKPGRRAFYTAWIRSRARLAYEEAAEILSGSVEHACAEGLRVFGALAKQLTKARLAGGAIDLDLPSAQLELGEDGRPENITPAERTAAHRAVEEAMLAANRAVAAQLLEAERAAIFRNHDEPPAGDTEALVKKLVAFGLARKGAALSAPVLAQAIREASPEMARVVHPLVLRAMTQARYGAECRGHYALAFDAYLHFTSPIRRYPDLVVHRALRAWIDDQKPPHPPQRVERMAARSSYRERLAERAEREVRELAKCAFLSGFVGDEEPGTVTGVARHGLYVMFDRWPIDGLVHVSRLPEFVFLDDDRLSLVAEGSGRRYSLGDRLRVRIAAVDIVQTRVDLEIVRILESAGNVSSR